MARSSNVFTPTQKGSTSQQTRMVQPICSLNSSHATVPFEPHLRQSPETRFQDFYYQFRVSFHQTDLAHTCTGMGATNSATGQGHSDHSNCGCHPTCTQGERCLGSPVIVTGSSTLPQSVIAVPYNGRLSSSLPPCRWDTALLSGCPHGFSMPKGETEFAGTLQASTW